MPTRHTGTEDSTSFSFRNGAGRHAYPIDGWRAFSKSARKIIRPDVVVTIKSGHKRSLNENNAKSATKTPPIGLRDHPWASAWSDIPPDAVRQTRTRLAV